MSFILPVANYTSLTTKQPRRAPHHVIHII